VNGLPKCVELVSAAPVGWRSEKVSDDFELSLPSCFQKEHEGGPPRYIHGGIRWRCDDGATAEVVWGMWGRDSFPEIPKCTAVVSGRSVMVARGDTSETPRVIVWYPTGSIHEPIVAAWSSRPEDKELVVAIAFSGRFGSRRK
jgi:hypothetical protein